MRTHYTRRDWRNFKTVEPFFYSPTPRRFKEKKKKSNFYLTFLHPRQLPGNQSCPTCVAGVPPVTGLLKLQSLFLLHSSLWLTVYSHFYQVGDWFLSSSDEILIKTEEAPFQHHQSRLIWTKIRYIYIYSIYIIYINTWYCQGAFAIELCSFV